MLQRSASTIGNLLAISVLIGVAYPLGMPLGLLGLIPAIMARMLVIAAIELTVVLMDIEYQLGDRNAS